MLNTINELLTADFVRELILKLAGGVASGLMVLAPVVYFYIKQQRALKKGDMRDVVLMVANIFEDSPTGSVIMKPRTIVASRPVNDVFANPAMAQLVVRAARGSDITLPDDAFIELDGTINNTRLGKKVVDNCSQLEAEGHLRRMFKLPVTQCDGYACITLAKDGDMETIRIDVIAEEDLKKFLDPDYRKSLSARDDEQSHDDMAAVFEICAKDVFVTMNKKEEGRSSRAFRVSFSFQP